MAEEILNKSKNESLAEVDETSIVPTSEEIGVLGPLERTGFWLTRRMNFGVWKRFWTLCQRHVGSLWIYIATYNLMNVFGIETLRIPILHGR
jgi:hypothetical protein